MKLFAVSRRDKIILEINKAEFLTDFVRGEITPSKKQKFNYEDFYFYNTKPQAEDCLEFLLNDTKLPGGKVNELQPA